jgi:ParB family chromosome partitioning protein
MSRKDTLRALLTARERRLPGGNAEAAASQEVETTPPKPLVRSGAVGAMGRSLGRIASAAEEVRAMIGAGATVVELPTSAVESSFVADRLAGADAEHESLVASMREHGQQVPILVRPHPTRQGAYQVAYGHRRLRAAIALGRPVRAVVREMSDAELVVAQGQENSARLDLSYIEKALFAITIEDRGFDRNVLMAALNLEKTQLSRLLSIGRGIPVEVIEAIGAAPKIGRPRWASLAESLGGRDWRPVLHRLAADPRFKAADSDSRFAQFDAALRRRQPEAETKRWRSPGGEASASIKRAGHRMTLVLDQKAAPGFGDFIVRALPELYRRHAEEAEGKNPHD